MEYLNIIDLVSENDTVRGFDKELDIDISIYRLQNLQNENLKY